MPIAPDVPYEVGEAAFGGYAVGVIDTTRPGSIIAGDAYQTGARYLLIVSPKTYETIDVWRAGATGAVPQARTRWDGLSAQRATLTAGLAGTFPTFGWCAGLPHPDDAGSEWYAPSLDEANLLYRALKPTTNNNTTGNRAAATFPGVAAPQGQNISSDPTGVGHTTGDPSQTTLADFLADGPQELRADGLPNAALWTATQSANNASWNTSPVAGGQVSSLVSSQFVVRPVRRILVDDLVTEDPLEATGPTSIGPGGPPATLVTFLTATGPTSIGPGGPQAAVDAAPDLLALGPTSIGPGGPPAALVTPLVATPTSIGPGGPAAAFAVALTATGPTSIGSGGPPAGLVAERTGVWTSAPIALTQVVEADTAHLHLDADLPPLTAVRVHTSVDHGQTWQPVGPAGVTLPADLDGVILLVRLTLTAYYTPPAVRAATLDVSAVERDETVLLGRFYVVEPARRTAGQGESWTVAGHDRSWYAARPLRSPFPLGLGDRTDLTIEALLQVADPAGTVLRVDTPEHTLPAPGVIPTGDDPWQHARRLAETIGCEVYVDHLDRYIIRPVPVPGLPVRTWQPGDGLLTSVEQRDDYGTLVNGAIVVSSSAWMDDPVVGQAWDDDPDSPVRRALVGEWPARMPASEVGSQGQADEAAAALLRRRAGWDRTVIATTVPDPSIEPWDTVVIDGAVEVVRRHTIPLDATSDARVEATVRRQAGG